jgi:hypothetical protein
MPDADAAASNSSTQFVNDGLLASVIPKSSKPCNDYDPMWLVYAHPTVFPHGRGQCPLGMGFDTWCRLTLQRHPVQQYAQNLGFIADMFNILQRHTVNLHSWLQLRLHPRMAAEICDLTPQDIQDVMSIAGKGLTGPALHSVMGSLPRPARTLLSGLKRAGGHVLGSPQSFLALRSKVLAPTTALGPYTCMINLNPAELGSEWTFKLAGKAYSFDAFGKPVGRPSVMDSLRLVAANPVACAEFIHAFFAAFCEVFLGWPMGSSKQTNPGCLFGAIYAAYLKYESSGRGGKHGHGQVAQAVLRAIWLAKFMSEGTAMQDLLFAFMESFSCACFPSPTRPFAAPEPQAVVRTPTGETSEHAQTMKVPAYIDCPIPRRLCGTEPAMGPHAGHSH